MVRSVKFLLLAGVCAVACGGSGEVRADQQPGPRRPIAPPGPAPTRGADQGTAHLGPAGQAPGEARGRFLDSRARAPTELVSVGLRGAAGDGFSFSWILGISEDGRYVSFDSEASNLVPGDTNRLYDTFVRDLRTNKTERVSVSSAGVQAEQNVFSALQSFLSADGRYVAFSSIANNLVPNDQTFPGDGKEDVFVRDRKAQTTERVSVSSGAVAANGHSLLTGMSADGRFVTFSSRATNLVPGYSSISNRSYVRDRKLGYTEPVCIPSANTPLPQLNECYSCGISADGRYIAFLVYDNDFNSYVFIRDRKARVTKRMSVRPQAYEGCAWVSLSASGRYLMLFPYDPADPALTGLYVQDLVRGTSERVRFNRAGEEPNDFYNVTHISADGRYIVFDSPATNLAPGDSNGVNDVFVLDRVKQTTRLVSVGADNQPSNGASVYAYISGSGKTVAFRSDATNLLPEPDGNPYTDIFAYALDRHE